MTTATHCLADFCAGIAYRHFDDQVKRAARRHILDTLGAIIAGGIQSENKRIAQVVDRWSEAGKIIVPGLVRRYDPFTAAYLIGAAGHGIELDDGYRAGSIHPGVVTIPALLVAAQLQPTTGASFMTAVVVGYEIAARLARAIHPVSRIRGFHNTAIVGPIAAAGAVGSLRGHCSSVVEHAFGLAASTSGGLFAFLHGGGDVKRLHSAHAVREGLLAALLAEENVPGPQGVLESKDGFLQAFSGKQDIKILLDGLGEGASRFAITQCYTKPYACCRHLHPAIDAVVDILHSESLHIDAINRVDIGTYPIGAEHAHTGWTDMASAQMSYPYVIATALKYKAVTLALFHAERFLDPTVNALCKRITVSVDPECDRLYPNERTAKVKIISANGQRFERFVRDPYGSETNPMSDEAIIQKFAGLAGPVLGNNRTQAISALVMRLDTVEDMSEFTELLGAPSSH